MSEEKKGELSSNPPTGSAFHPPNNRNDKVPFIRRRGRGGAYIDRTVDKASFVIQDYQTQYFGRPHRNHYNDAILIENSFLL